MKTKILITLIILIMLFLLPEKIKKIDIAFSELNMCFDIRICKEGIVIGAGSDNPILINKENCLKHSWLWNDEKKWCDMRPKQQEK